MAKKAMQLNHFLNLIVPMAISAVLFQLLLFCHTHKHTHTHTDTHLLGQMNLSNNTVDCFLLLAFTPAFTFDVVFGVVFV